jgi:hypothetical protein
MRIAARLHRSLGAVKAAAKTHGISLKDSIRLRKKQPDFFPP